MFPAIRGLTGTDLSRIKSQADAALRFKEKYKQRLEDLVDAAVHTSVQGATGLALGFLDGYFYQSGGVGLGIPLSLWTGLIGHGAAILFEGKAAPYLHSMANAGLVAWAHQQGRNMGQNLRDKKPLLGSHTKVSGDIGDGTRLSPEELAAVAQGRAS